MQERDLRKTARSLQEAAGKPASTVAQGPKPVKAEPEAALAALIETRMVNAAWVLRRLPDREKGFLRMRGALWPETLAEPGTYPRAAMSAFEARRRVRISAAEIDQMQPTLDLLLLLPDITDRQIVFWAAWHQEGETGNRISWVKVRRSLGLTLSRWTLKRRYEASLMWLAALVALQ